jgi:hypothetical protein
MRAFKYLQGNYSASRVKPIGGDNPEIWGEAGTKEGFKMLY